MKVLCISICITYVYAPSFPFPGLPSAADLDAKPSKPGASSSSDSSSDSESDKPSESDEEAETEEAAPAEKSEGGAAKAVKRHSVEVISSSYLGGSSGNANSNAHSVVRILEG